MKVLWVSTWFPFPLDAGSRIRVHYLLRALAKQHLVHLVAFVPRDEDLATVAEVRSWGVEVEAVRRNPFLRDPRRAVLGYFSARPRDVVACHSPEMARLVESAAASRRYDVAVASCTPAAGYLVRAGQMPRLLEEHNFMTSWMEEQYRGQHNLARRGLRWLTWQKSLRYERRLYAQFDACTMVSEVDRRAMQAALPGYAGRVEVLPNGVDLERNRPDLAEPGPDALVFNGSLTYHANLEAMRWFTAQVWPLVRRERPGARLRITGRSDGVDLGWLPPDGSIALTGSLEDVRPAVAGAWACVAPLRSGGGTRLKILEAMALGTPVVATSKGAEGLDVTAEQDLLVAGEPSAFAAQVVRLLADRALRRRLAARGRALVEARYGWRAIGERFCALVESLRG